MKVGYLGELWHLKHVMLERALHWSQIETNEKQRTSYTVSYVSKTENPTGTLAQNSEISLKFSESRDRNLKSYIFINNNTYFNKLSAD